MRQPIVLPDRSLVVPRYDSIVIASVLKALLGNSATAPQARRLFSAFIDAVEEKRNPETLPGTSPGDSNSKLGSAEAARILGVSPRRVCQLGERIGGRQLPNGRWEFDAAKVYAEAARRGRA
ncbi:hypothetical protein [Streptomyces sp. SP17KL33]|uniref:hypothetical protein n=1 Tax=Streptomyces sp. SP17KL33 TaxID=3002534 RepID=UPI002E75C80F|nr:hypothetical protein [Streptomyces sp. SP17KL33]MEE1834912.1 hypothetical protein [Streptomyces sp. SP17KL33]